MIICPLSLPITKKIRTVVVGALVSISEVAIQGAAEKSGPLNFFAVFSATVWDFNTKFYSFIY